ncbi:hypothetical protein SEVIR_2G281000v4 [Setaria viridis]|uniref:RING-type domain-containing protein n=1 Tax=Setaria viridis TaxID=4556 RepID=A0A4U6VVS8_SETVI|nr:uncharacterized protein LOC117846022 [Setaria viridis]TKW34070.1 hypothetical protein SEVIR_2G281000v2 [Setaria viridis]
MDLDATPPEPPTCTICLDPVVAHEHDGARSVALLLCGHKFHLDCIGSAFNARGLMQCPNCRNIEDGNWLNPNVLQPSTDSPWATIALADFLGQSPFDGSAPLDYLFQNRRLEPISSGLEGDQTAELSNVQVFDGTEPRNSEIEQHNIGILPMVDPANRLTTPFGFDVPRYDGNNQRRSTQSTTRSRSSSVAPLGSSPAVTSVGHGHGLRGQVVQETAPPATRSSPFPPTTRRA